VNILNEIEKETEACHRLAVMTHEKVDWNVKLWKKLRNCALKKGLEPGITNKMTAREILVFISQFPDYLHRQLFWDMTNAKYKLWDEICMLMMSRTKGYNQPEHLERTAQKIAEDLAKCYIKVSEKAVSQRNLYELFTAELEGK